jgi:serine/threonine protein kinase
MILNEDLKIDNKKKIGEGSFGNVYLSKWRKTKVVSKIANNNLSEESKILIERELDILTKVKHPNIVQFLGYIDSPFIIVTEYIQEGDLLKYIINDKLNFKAKINICLDILQALIYLHNRKPDSIIHRDLKPQNILITSLKVAKIADFGLSKLFGQNIKNSSNDYNYYIEDLTSNVGSKRYMAPELQNNTNYDYKIDIWSCGVIFAELFENRRFNLPFEFLKTKNTIKEIIQNHMICNVSNRILSTNEIYDLFFNLDFNVKCCIYRK